MSDCTSLQEAFQPGVALSSVGDELDARLLAGGFPAAGGTLPGGNRAGGTGAVLQPPSDNMGVKNSISFHVDYLRITAWIEPEYLEYICKKILQPQIGEWVKLDRGGRFYDQVFQAHLGARLYTVPSVEALDQRQVTVELPGQACQFLGFFQLQQLYIQLWMWSERISVTRIDLAFDRAPFSPKEFYEALLAGECRTYAKRETFKITEGAFERRENGMEGCSTVTVARRESPRYLRVYDKHGETRVELECHDKKASQVAEHLFGAGGEGQEVLDLVYQRAMGNLRDFIDITRDWWEAFTTGIVRAYQQLTGGTAQEIDAEAVATYVYKQVSAAFSVFVDVFGEASIQTLLRVGRVKRKRNQRYRVIMGGEV